MNSKDSKEQEAKVPHHVAMIMDGNGRWAKKKLMNRVKGHERGMETVREIVRAARDAGISILTLYAFSTENWNRPKIEVAALMTLLNRYLKTEIPEMMEKNTRLNFIGETHLLPKNVRASMEKALETTGKNTGMILNLALSYGSRSEITQMVRAIAVKARDMEIHPDDITPDMISDHLYTRGMKDPDLLIRTSGEMRISNFLLWQIAYSEIFITKTLWPDFNKEEFYKILEDYQKRDRRFGVVK